MSKRPTPAGASIAAGGEGGKLHAPSAERNAQVIGALLASVAPERGEVLEIASGTGQHIVAFARTMPGLIWQASEVDHARIASINAYIAESGLGNLAAPCFLDATAPDWAESVTPKDMIYLVNLLHLISDAEYLNVLEQATMALKPGGVFVIYGPFKRSGVLISEGDQRFDAQLRVDQPDIGYKDDVNVVEMLKMNGLAVETPVEMPANNLAILARKP